MGYVTQKWVKLLVPFTSGYSRKFTESELSSLSGVPQQTASRLLSQLVKANLVSYEKQGRNKLFSITGLPSSGALLQLIESQKALEFYQRAKDASVIINELLKHSESIILFGSYSAYTHNEDSDIDLVIVGKADKEKIKSAKQKFPVQVNEQYVSYKELSDAIKNKNPLAIELIKSHIIFGDISIIVRKLHEL